MVSVGTQYRQGDVLLVAAQELPPDLEPLSLSMGELLPLVPGGSGGSHLVSPMPDSAPTSRGLEGNPSVGSRSVAILSPTPSMRR
jgi:hypothetical protein